MLAFLDKVKIVDVGGLRVKIFKRSVREVYLLFYAFNAVAGVSGDIFTFLVKRSSDELARLNRLLSVYFRRFYRFASAGDHLRFLLSRGKYSLLRQIYTEVVRYNVGVGGDEGKPVSFDSLTSDLYYAVSQLFFYSKRPIDEILGLTFDEIRVLLVNLNYYRFNVAVDVAGSWNLEEFKRILKIR